MTVAEIIIARRAGRKRVEPGEVLLVQCDIAMGSEIIFPQILTTLNDLGWSGAVKLEKIAAANGHLVSTREAAAGTLVMALDRFALQYGVERYFQVGRDGDCQTLLGEKGIISPGSLVVGSDQHFTTYGALGSLATGVGGVDLATIWTTGATWMIVPKTVKVLLVGRLRPYATPKDLALTLLSILGTERARECAIEFGGDALPSLGMPDRFMLCNLAVETGAKFAWMPVDTVTKQYLSRHGVDSNASIRPDPDACYHSTVEIDLDGVVPMASPPYLPTNGVPITDIGPIPVNQVLVGTCTNGRIEDFRQVATLLNSHDLHEGVRLGLYPASHQAVRDIVEEDLALLFTRRGASISPPSCQACLGSGPSLLGENEVGIYTTNRNYRGRHGPPSAKVYLAGPLAATASAITGYLTDPRELL